MKMKEVLAATGLTDRAVRLYAENGLIAPENERTHSGRNCLNFSEQDVELLKKISTLRKAGFSLAQIKSIETDSRQAQVAVNELLAEKKAEQEINGKVIAALDPIKDSDDISMDVICDSLRESMSGAKVPESDMKMSAGENVEKLIFTVLACVGIGNLIILLIRAFRIDFERFEFPVYEISFNGALLGRLLLVAIPIVFCIVIIIMYRIRVTGKTKRILRGVIAILLCVLYIPTAFIPLLSIAISAPSTFSATNKYENYLKLDTRCSEHAREIHDLFPNYIPYWDIPDENTIKYNYEYHPIYIGLDSYEEDANFNITAEWTLTDEAYKDEVERLLGYERCCGPFTNSYGWTTITLSDSDGEAAGQFFYRDDTNTVRYVFDW